MDLPLCKIQDHLVLAQGPQAITLYNKGYYGKPNKDGLILNGYEALHLFERGKIIVFHGEQQFDQSQILQYFAGIDEDFVERYLVYKDLRNRGYIVNQGEGSSFFFRLYEKGAIPKQDSAKYYVTPLQEGGSINLGDLEYLIQLAKKAKKQLIIGLVDAVGDVSYLKISEFVPHDISEGKIFSNFVEWNWEEIWHEFVSEINK